MKRLLLLFLLAASPTLAQEGLSIRTLSPDQIVYDILELGNNTPPVAWNSAAFNTAGVVPFIGFDNTTGFACTVKWIWKRPPLAKAYLSFNCADTDDEQGEGLTNDSAAWFSGAGSDRVDVRFRPDTLRAFDSSLRAIGANLQPVYRDGTYPNGVFDGTQNFNTSVVRVVNAGASWQIFLTFDLPDTIAPHTLGLCNIAVQDKDSGTAITTRMMRGTSSNSLLAIQDYAFCRFSNSILPAPPPDTVAPTVGTPTFSLVTQNSMRVTSTVSEPASCVVRYGIGSPTTALPAVSSIGGACVADLSNLQASTTYVATVTATDPSGNSTASAQGSQASAAPACTLYAGPTAAGDGKGSNLANRGTVAAMLTASSAGTIICLDDGTYTGAAAMIAPGTNKSGTSGNPITVRAINDGLVTIDGQGARRPIALINNNDWFVIEGMNAKDSSAAVVAAANGSSNNIFRRIAAWDAPGTAADNYMIYQASGIGTNNNLFEDVAGWGKARKIFDTSDRAANTTVRRAFAIWQESARTGPKMAYTNTYDTTGAVYENVIGMWNQQAGDPTEPYGLFAQDAMQLAYQPSYCANSKYLGAIGLIRSGHSVSNSMLGGAFGSRSVNCTLFKDMVLYNDPGTHTALRAFQMQLFDGGSAGLAVCVPDCDRQLNAATTVGWTVADSINVTANGWTVTNKNNYATIAAMNSATANPFQTAAGTGARVCFRYENGVLTSTKLWPWPMDARINAALTASGRSVATYFTGTNTLTQYIESVFGTIPAGCKA